MNAVNRWKILKRYYKNVNYANKVKIYYNLNQLKYNNKIYVAHNIINK